MPFSIVGQQYQPDFNSLLNTGQLNSLSQPPANGANAGNMLPFFLQGGSGNYANNQGSLAQILGMLGVAPQQQGTPLPAGIANPNATPSAAPQIAPTPAPAPQAAAPAASAPQGLDPFYQALIQQATLGQSGPGNSYQDYVNNWGNPFATQNGNAYFSYGTGSVYVPYPGAPSGPAVGAPGGSGGLGS